MERAAELTRHADDLFTIDHDLKVGPVDFGTRTTVVRLAGGGLVLHSPGPLEDLRAAGVEELGEVVAIVAPNLFHHFFVGECANHFSAARVFAPQGLAEKCPDVRVDETLEREAPALWRGQLEQVALAGAPKVAETLFFHRASKTLLVTDLVFNFQHSDSLFTRLLMRLMGAWQRFGPSRLFKTMLRDKAAARAAIDEVLRWDFDRVIVTHGEICETGGRETLRDAYAWLRG